MFIFPKFIFPRPMGEDDASLCGEIRLVARIDPHEACWVGEDYRACLLVGRRGARIIEQLGDGLPMDKDVDNRNN